MGSREKIQKFIAIITIIIICSFAVPNYSHAIDSKLGNPFQAFGCFVGDAILNGLQTFFIGGDKAVESENKKNADENLNIKYSVANIVSNKIPIFIVNFFTGGKNSEVEKKDKYVQGTIKSAEYAKTKTVEVLNKYNDKSENGESFSDDEILSDLSSATGTPVNMQGQPEDGGHMFSTTMDAMISSYDLNNVWKEIHGDEYLNSDLAIIREHDFNYMLCQAAAYKVKNVYNKEINDYDALNTINQDDINEKYVKFFNEEYLNAFCERRDFNNIPTFNVSAWEKAYQELMPVLEKIDKNSTKVEKRESSASILKPIVQKWYYIFRNIALIALLSILVYLGIKIVLSSAAEDKARYKKLLTNWFTAIALLFALHYIMAFTLIIVDEVNDLLSVNIVSSDGTDSLITNIRTKAGDKNATGGNRMTYTILYLVLIIYTLKFSWVYIKRVLHMTFLTIIAPLIAITYPIDKEKDGKAQAFDMWTKEYFFNAILQPVHLLLYYVLVSSASSLVDDNWIYAIVVIGFMSHAEKLIRKMFNMDKAGNASTLGSFAGGAITSSVLSSLAGNKGSSISGRSSDNLLDGTGDNNGIKMAKLDDVFGNSESAENNEIGKSTNSSYNPNVNININAGSNTNPTVSVHGLDGATQGYGYTKESGTIEVPNIGKNLSSNSKISVGGSNLNITMPSVQQLREMGMTPQEYREAQEKKQEQERETNRQTTSKNKKPQKTIMSRRLSGVKNVAGTAAKKVFTSQNAKTVIRTATNLTAGVVGGTVGAAAGIASGDFSKTIQYAGTGAAASVGTINGIVSAGEKITGKTIDIARETVNTYKKGYYDDDKEYQDKELIPKLKEKNSKDAKVKEKYKKAGFDDWKEAMNSSARDKLYHAGIVNEETIITALKVQEKNNITDDELVQDVIVASNISSYKDAQTMGKELKARLQDSGMDEEKAEKEAKRRMKHIKSISGL